MKLVEQGGVRVAVCNVEGTYYAVEDVCTHDDGPLGEGSLRGAELECPRHGARFDVKSGAALRMPAVVPVRTFPVKVVGVDLVVEGL
ncbi:non-heme iron oxygenase ferredoxin subunit [bacterium]|nr:MAG: non-heme iron oxygenase ferredoxin subunit [bacterium]